MQNQFEWRGISVTRPRLPKEAQDTSPESICFLCVLNDFQVTSVTDGCLLIRYVVLGSFERPNMLDWSADELYNELAGLRSADASSIKRKLEYAIQVMWESCDYKYVMERYFPNGERKMPHYSDVMAFLKLLFDMVDVNLRRYNWKR